MKKFLMVLVVFLAIYGLETKEAQAVRVTIRVTTGSGSDCSGRGICNISIEIAFRTAPTGGSNGQTIDGTAEVKGDKLYVTLSKGLSDMAANEKGVKSVSIKRPQRVSQDVSKQLGLSDLVILPSDYVMDGNSFVFDVKATPATSPVKGAATMTK